jgi:dihydropteroate synthase
MTTSAAEARTQMTATGRVHVQGLPDLGRAYVIGVLNVTPDSFSDGGSYLDPDAAIAHGIAMSESGADLVDVGGESTRPGAERIEAATEIDRTVLVVAALAARGIAVSIDTTRAEVAAAALDAGAVLVNDVSGGAADREMYGLIARREVPYVLMHSRGASVDMAQRAVYGDVVPDVRDELAQRLTAAIAAGVDVTRIVLDPGIGFHKTAAHNWALLSQLGVLAELGRPLLVGTSRKSFLGRLLVDANGDPRPASGRDVATHATTALAVAAGAWGVRVHDVGGSADAVRVASAWMTAGGHRA